MICCNKIKTIILKCVYILFTAYIIYLEYSILYCMILYYIMVYTILFYTILYYIIPYYIIL